jgi:hypothetical protein
MSGSSQFVLTHYNGQLILNNAAQASFLKNAAGTTLLMVLDPTQSGNYSHADVVAAWQHFSQTSNSGAAIAVSGFLKPPTPGSQPVLHVVQA